ncbi:MAG: hypothetical protein JW904_07760 [Spirochaetales bacterium]|nr:hypothetical protein [Spirochaetales bacterium]
MDQEKLRILKMIEDGKISAEEGSRLMEALETQESATREKQPENPLGAQLHIKVSDIDSGTAKVNLTIPIGIAHMVKSLIPAEEIEKLEKQGINLNAIFALVSSGSVGKILDIEDQENNHHIVISVE